jgi:hypothetical protein
VLTLRLIAFALVGCPGASAKRKFTQNSFELKWVKMIFGVEYQSAPVRVVTEKANNRP